MQDRDGNEPLTFYKYDPNGPRHMDVLHGVLRDYNLSLWPMIARPNAVVRAEGSCVGLICLTNSEFDKWECMRVDREGATSGSSLYYNVMQMDLYGNEIVETCRVGIEQKILLPLGEPLLVSMCDDAMRVYSPMVRHVVHVPEGHRACHSMYGKAFVCARLSHPVGTDIDASKVYVLIHVKCKWEEGYRRFAVGISSVRHCTSEQQDSFVRDRHALRSLDDSERVVVPAMMMPASRAPDSGGCVVESSVHVEDSTSIAADAAEGGAPSDRPRFDFTSPHSALGIWRAKQDTQIFELQRQISELKQVVSRHVSGACDSDRNTEQGNDVNP